MIFDFDFDFDFIFFFIFFIFLFPGNVFQFSVGYIFSSRSTRSFCKKGLNHRQTFAKMFFSYFTEKKISHLIAKFQDRDVGLSAENFADSVVRVLLIAQHTQLLRTEREADDILKRATEAKRR